MPAPRPLADNDTFITMLVVAGEDGKVRKTLRKILTLPDAQRHVAVRDWAAQLGESGAPRSFIAAVAALADDRVAWRVHDALFRGRFEAIWPPYTPPGPLGRFRGYSLRGRVLLVAALAFGTLAALTAAGVWLAHAGALERGFATLCLVVVAALLFSASDA